MGCAFAACLERKQRREKECGVTAAFDASRTSFAREGSFRLAGGGRAAEREAPDKKKGGCQPCVVHGALFKEVCRLGAAGQTNPGGVDDLPSWGLRYVRVEASPSLGRAGRVEPGLPASLLPASPGLSSRKFAKHLLDREHCGSVIVTGKAQNSYFYTILVHGSLQKFLQ